MNSHIERPVKLFPETKGNNHLGKAHTYSALIRFYMRNDSWKFMEPKRMRFILRKALNNAERISPQYRKKAECVFEKLCGIDDVQP